MEVRRAGAGDVAAIADVHVRSWQETYAGQVPQDYLDALSVEQRRIAWTSIYGDTDWPSTGILVLIDDGAIVGFAHICQSRDDDATSADGELTAIYLRRAAWGHGGGRELMTVALAALGQAAFTAATLWVLDSNDRARRFYEAGDWHWDGTDKLDVIGGQHIRELRYRRRLD